MFRIIESIPSRNAEPIKKQLAHLGSERIDEVFDSSITVQRAVDTYRAKGYSEEWIIKRIKGIQDRKKLTDTWNEHGVSTEKEYAILTNEIYKEWSGLGGIATRELAKKHKPLGLNENKKVARNDLKKIWVNQ